MDEINLYNEAFEVVNWHLFSDKTTDKKPSNMTIEEAEEIIHRFNLKK